MPANSKKVFIVHGHNLQLRDEVGKYITSLGSTPVILSEQANRGETVIEKFEREASVANYAVILLTGDDRGLPSSVIADKVEATRSSLTRLNETGVAVKILAKAMTPGLGMTWEQRINAWMTYLESMPCRARQNVILELGYFIGRLGRKHVCVLNDPHVETPSDIMGIVTIMTSGDWRSALRKELQAANML